ncbi:YdeI family protein [Streptomyces sp. NPDC014734]|uniref:YdeI/OmpD-associated family protein n=1 Tax=Streptomyces sp. NPDC014734 TaxID=3364886 RepID=UPI0036F58E91
MGRSSGRGSVSGAWFTAGVTQDREIITFETAEDFEAWLGEHHAASSGAWLRLRKKRPGISSLDYAQALDVALCYGWIDGQKAKVDEEWWMQRFTPRRPRSRWSKVNRGKVAALIEQGRMRPPGLAEIERAKADGRWEAAYDGSRTASVPDDLAAALQAVPVAQAAFETLNRQNRYAILYRVHDAKKPETRTRRIAKYVAMLANGETIHP